jgi:predicted nucleic acid-binding protein
MLVAAHSLMESYSVLTRLPPPRHLPPATALRLLEESFGTAEASALDAEAYRHLLRVAPHRGITGGRIYDAIIYACARAAGADTLLTFNEQHFLAVADGQIEIVVPQEQKDPASASLPAPE